MFLTLASFAFSDTTPGKIEQALRSGFQHPYLFFTEEEKPVILDRIKNDPECSDIMRRLIAEANRLIYTPVEKQAPTQSKLDSFFGYNDWYNYLNRNEKAAFRLAFVYQMTGNKKYAYKAFEFADALCIMPTWVNTYEMFPIIYTRVWPWNVSDDQVNFTYNHIAARVTATLATVFDWLYPALTQRQRDRIRGTLLEKAILLVRGNYEYHWWATAYRCNWCTICNSGLGVAALALLPDHPQLVDVVAESYNRVVKTLDEIGIDGGWQEGCGYWGYGLYHTIPFAEALKRTTNGKFNLFEHPKIARNTVNCPLYNFISPHSTVNFEDSGSYIVGSTFLYNKLATETGSNEAAWYRENLLGDGNSIFDIIWPRSTVLPALPEKTSIHFRTIDWAVMRSDFTDPEKVLIACKAGYNEDPHHGHLDCGQFIIYWRGVGFIAEMPRVDYDEFYFQKERWDYPAASSVGHNVVFVNGELQIPSKLKDQPWEKGIGGKILEFRTSKTRDYTLMDTSGAYPGKELKGWRRHIILEKPLITVLLDEIKSSKGAEIETRFHSEVVQRIGDGYLLLDSDKGDMALIPVIDGEFTFRPEKHMHTAVKKDASSRWVSYCGTVLIAESEYTVIATVILPVESEDEANDIMKSAKRKIDQSGNFNLSFITKGETSTLNFIKNEEGLVLQ